MDIGIGKVRQIFNVVQESFPYDSPWKHHNIDFRELKAQSPQTDDFVRMQKLISVEEKNSKNLGNLVIICIIHHLIFLKN